jgi:hypothetical protein
MGLGPVSQNLLKAARSTAMHHYRPIDGRLSDGDDRIG